MKLIYNDYKTMINDALKYLGSETFQNNNANIEQSDKSIIKTYLVTSRNTLNSLSDIDIPSSSGGGKYLDYLVNTGDLRLWGAVLDKISIAFNPKIRQLIRGIKTTMPLYSALLTKSKAEYNSAKDQATRELHAAAYISATVDVVTIVSALVALSMKALTGTVAKNDGYYVSLLKYTVTFFDSRAVKRVDTYEITSEAIWKVANINSLVVLNKNLKSY